MLTREKNDGFGPREPLPRAGFRLVAWDRVDPRDRLLSGGDLVGLLPGEVVEVRASRVHQSNMHERRRRRGHSR